MTKRSKAFNGAGLVASFLCLAMAGCAGLVLEPAEKARTRELTAEALAAKVWTVHSGARYLRQTALFEFGDRKMAADGLLRFDPAEGTARLVALSEVGLKLFDLTVTRDAVTENFVLPELAKGKGLSSAVATCLRAVFLTHEPRAGDRLDRTEDRYELTRQDGDGRLLCVFSGLETLLFKDYEGKEQSWTIRFFDYQPYQSLAMPGRTVFTDRRAGYRVSLWLKEVKEAHD